MSGAGNAGAACSFSTPFSSFPFLAFLRIFTRSTICGLYPVLSRRGGDARGVDGGGVFAKGIEEGGGGQGVDQARDAAGEGVDLGHGVGGERVAPAAGDADAVLDVAGRLF